MSNRMAMPQSDFVLGRSNHSFEYHHQDAISLRVETFFAYGRQRGIGQQLRHPFSYLVQKESLRCKPSSAPCFLSKVS
jgi:hypothetical protein